MYPVLKVAFSDFIFNKHSTDGFSGFNQESNYFTDLLSVNYDVKEASFDDADVLIYSTFGNEHRKFRGKKIFYTTENVLHDFEECDFAITFCHLPNEPRHFRLPQYIHYVKDAAQLLKSEAYAPLEILKHKNKFCNFVATNPRANERNKFFRLLNRSKSVDSGGRHFNNLGNIVADKLAFIRDYKFTLALENSSSPGYTTEKLVEAMLANSLPIYWGNPDVARDFNPRSFINISDFPSFEAAVDHILKVDSDDQLYLSYLREPWFNNNCVPDWFRPEYTASALKKFVASPWLEQPRVYKNRGLRDHVLGTGLKRQFASLRGKLDGLIWKAGWR